MSLQFDNSLTTPDQAYGIDRLRLRFRDPAIERKYLSESLDEARTLIRTYLVAAALLYLMFGILDWVVGAVTFGIFTPMDVRITCAASGAMLTPDGATLKVAGNATETERNDALALALTLAKKSGTAVYVVF